MGGGAYKGMVEGDGKILGGAVQAFHGKQRRRRRPPSAADQAARAELKRKFGDVLKADIQRRKEAGNW